MLFRSPRVQSPHSLRFKRKQSPENQRMLLVFDQFEEFFSYPPDQQEAFRWQLADLLLTDIPQELRDNFDKLSDAAVDFLCNPMHIKVVFSIREDRMAWMDSLKDALPTILHKRYELRPLTRKQAQEAIERPAQIADMPFVTPPFDYTEGAMTRMLDELSNPAQGNRQTVAGVEAFQLQIVCRAVEKTVEKGGIADLNGNGLPDVDIPHLPDFKNLYEDYYHQNLAELTPSVKTAAQQILEEVLLADDPETGEAKRKSVDSHDLQRALAKNGLTTAVLLDLEKTYLIRREANTVGGFSYEISHDTLVAPIQKSKKERLAIEEQQRISRRNRRLALLVLLIGGLAVGAIAFGLWAFQQKNKAEIAIKGLREVIPNLDSSRHRSMNTFFLLEKQSADLRMNIAVLDMELSVLQRKMEANKIPLDGTKMQLYQLEMSNNELNQIYSKMFLEDSIRKIMTNRLYNILGEIEKQ